MSNYSGKFLSANVMKEAKLAERAFNSQWNREHGKKTPKPSTSTIVWGCQCDCVSVAQDFSKQKE